MDSKEMQEEMKKVEKEQKKLKKDIKRRKKYNKKVGSPLCCFMFDLPTASLILGVFYSMPALVFYNTYKILMELHFYTAIATGIVVMFTTITALLCLWNICQPSVSICDYISVLQTYTAYVFIIIAFPILTLAIIQKLQPDWKYGKALEDKVDEVILHAADQASKDAYIRRWLRNAGDKRDTAAGLFLIMGLLPIAFASLGLGIAIDFNRMAHFIFNAEVIADYNALNKMEGADAEDLEIKDAFNVEEFGAIDEEMPNYQQEMNTRADESFKDEFQVEAPPEDE